MAQNNGPRTLTEDLADCPDIPSGVSLTENGTSALSSEKPLRADRLLAGLGYGSRREVASFIHAGDLCVDGRTIEDPAEKLSPDQARRATLAGSPLDPLPPLTIMLHKPAGYVCSRNDAGALVYDLLPARFSCRTPPLSCAGRLDSDSTGLVLMTDDGQLLHRIIAPKSHPPKYYTVVLEDPLRADAARIFASGTLMLEGEKKPLKPVILRAIDSHTIELTLYEGRYHQIRRMVGAIGNCVASLHRSRIGRLDLGDLAPGTYRALDERDVAALFTDVIR